MGYLICPEQYAYGRSMKRGGPAPMTTCGWLPHAVLHRRAVINGRVGTGVPA